MILRKFTILLVLISLATSVPLNAANIVAKAETTGTKSIGSFLLSLKDKFHNNKQHPKAQDTTIIGRATNAVTTHQATTNANTQTHPEQTASTPYPTTTRAAQEAGAANSAAAAAAVEQQQQQHNEGGHQTTSRTTTRSGDDSPSSNSGPSSAVKSEEEEEEDSVIKTKEPIWRLDRVTNYAGIGSGLLLGYVYVVTELQSFTKNGMPDSTVSVKVISTSKFFTDPCEVATLSGAPDSIILSASSACASL